MSGRGARYRTPYGARGGIGSEFKDTEAVPQPDANVAVLGHSQVGRLAAFNFGPVAYKTAGGVSKHYRFNFFTAPGATIQSLRGSDAWQRAILLRPAVTFLFIGGNDVVSGREPITYAQDLQRLVEEYRELAGGKIHIFPIEIRTNPRGLSVDEYNKIRLAVNRHLKRGPKTSQLFMSIPFKKDELQADGVHINGKGCLWIIRFIARIACKDLEQ